MKPRIPSRILSLLTVTASAAGISSQNVNAADWVGGVSQDWNTVGNWSTTPAIPTGDFVIKTNAVGVFPVISADSVFTPNDLIIGDGGGNLGRLDQTAGTAGAGNGNWFFVGRNGGTGEINTSGGTLTAGELYVGGGAYNGTGTGTINIDGGSVTANSTADFGDGSGANIALGVQTGSNGTINLLSGSLTASTGELRVNVSAGATGTINQSGGTTSSAGYLGIGRYGTGTFNLSGGTVNASTDFGFTNIGGAGGSVGLLNVTGGTYDATHGGIIVGHGWTGSGTAAGTLTVADSGTVNLGANNLQIGGGAIASGTVNLNGGTILAESVSKGDGLATFNFNGGTLKPTANNSNFMAGLTDAIIKDGGAIIDTNGFDIGIGQDLTDGGTGGGLTKIGVGTLTLAGDSGYTGTTSINGGTLAITGSVVGPVSVSTAGMLAVGEASPSFNMASMSLASLSLATGGSIGFDVTSPSDNDQLTITTASGLSISGGGVSLYDAGTSNALSQTGIYTLINYSGTLTGSISGLTVANPRVGYAYEFADTGSAITLTVSLTNDTDGDGMPDVYEDANGLNKLVNDANGNLDGDFSTNYEEYLAGTDPQSAGSDANNTDNDGLQDSWEIYWFGDITAQNGSGDPDGDYATNLEEQTADTDPLYRISAPDADGDGMGDAWEIHHFTNTTTATGISDTDGDTFTDVDEFYADTDPNNSAQTPDDTDADGLADSWEYLYFSNLDQVGTTDPDGDYATNEQEETAGTGPTDRTNAPDGDGDGIGDAWEIHYFANTTTATATGDFDSDTVSDLDEFLNNTNPASATDPYSGTAAMTWVTPVTITSNSDILSTGTLIHAGNFRSDNIDVSVTAGSETINFKNRKSQDEPGDLLAGEEARVIAGSLDRQVNGALFDAIGTTVDTAFESVLDGSAWEDTDPGPAPGLSDMILRVTGVNGTALVVGQQYQIQLFYSDDRAGLTTREQIFHDDVIGGNASDPVLAGDSKAVVGTFTASALGYQDIHIQNTSGGANFPVGINAYVLRTVGVANPDTDGDGMADAWETSNFGNLSQTATGDFDGDNTNNLTEYRLGLTPTSGTSFFAVTRDAGGLLTWPSATGLTFIVQRSTTLGSWSDIATVPGTAGTATYTDPAPPTGKAFYRVLLQP